eukprot:1941391-Amphidinium_carterae.1
MRSARPWTAIHRHVSTGIIVPTPSTNNDLESCLNFVLLSTTEDLPPPLPDACRFVDRLFLVKAAALYRFESHGFAHKGTQSSHRTRSPCNLIRASAVTVYALRAERVKPRQALSPTIVAQRLIASICRSVVLMVPSK